MMLVPESRRRLVLSMTLGLVMGIVMAWAGWVGAALGYDAHGPPNSTRYRMGRLCSAIEAYRASQMSYPADLASLCRTRADSPSTPLPENAVLDGWGRPLLYSCHDGSFTITSLGADGQPGGDGIDTDLIAGGPSSNVQQATDTMTLLQFLTRPRTRPMLIWCLICMGISNILCFVTMGGRDRQPSRYGMTLVGYLIMIAVSAFFTYVMALIEIAKYH